MRWRFGAGAFCDACPHRTGDDLCGDCNGRKTAPRSLPEAVLGTVLSSIAVWRQVPLSGRITGLDTTELRARLIDLPPGLLSEAVSLAYAVEAPVAAILRGDDDADT